jgi:hypothetical protein
MPGERAAAGPHTKILEQGAWVFHESGRLAVVHAARIAGHGASHGSGGLGNPPHWGGTGATAVGRAAQPGRGAGCRRPAARLSGETSAAGEERPGRKGRGPAADAACACGGAALLDSSSGAPPALRRATAAGPPGHPAAQASPRPLKPQPLIPAFLCSQGELVHHSAAWADTDSMERMGLAAWRPTKHATWPGRPSPLCSVPTAAVPPSTSEQSLRPLECALRKTSPPGGRRGGRRIATWILERRRGRGLFQQPLRPRPPMPDPYTGHKKETVKKSRRPRTPDLDATRDVGVRRGLGPSRAGRRALRPGFDAEASGGRLQAGRRLQGAGAALALRILWVFPGGRAGARPTPYLGTMRVGCCAPGRRQGGLAARPAG